MLHDSDSLPLPRLEYRSDLEKDPSDGDGEKEAKRQRSEPATPVSTSSSPMNMMLSWGSHEWELRKLKGLRRV